MAPNEVLGNKGFEQELAVLEAVGMRHENVLEVMRYNPGHDGYFFLVMPELDGDLTSRLGSMSAEQSRRVLLDAFTGLKSLHENNFLQ